MNKRPGWIQRIRNASSLAVWCSLAGVLSALPACAPPSTPPGDLVSRGKEIFFDQTFNGNGRTCGTCHPARNNFTIDPAFIATLPPTDPLFAAEFNPELRKNFEIPKLMRRFGLILENLDGFDDLENKFVMRGVPHVLAQRTSVASNQGPRTGWSGDGAPGDGSLRSFAAGAVIQHFTKTLNRVPGVDFRLPTEAELDALEAFMLSLGRQQDLTLPLPLTGTVAKRGQEIFLDNGLGKCNLCHVNAGATANFGAGNVGNANFNTGVENLPDQPADLAGERNPPDDGFGRPGDGTFNTPTLVEAADTGPFFHNNAVETIEGAVAFYNGDAFNRSPSGLALARTDPRGVGIRLDATQVVAVAAFLRVLNALENIRQGIELLESSAAKGFADRAAARELLERAVSESQDSIKVLDGAGLHPEAVAHLQRASTLARKAARSFFRRGALTRQAIDEQRLARAQLTAAP
jgi:hypothetical protein